MRKVVFVCLLLGACAKHDDYPVGGGGGGGTGSMGGGPDAPTGDDGGTGTTIEGHVCLVTNLATPFSACDDANASGITVALGGHTTTTTLGGFTITKPLSTSVTWQVTGTGLVPSTMPFGPVALIPVIKKADYDGLAVTNNVAAGAGQGVVVANIVHVGTDGLPHGLPNIVATPTTADGPLYDPPSGDAWNIKTKTGSGGTAWYPDFPAGLAQSITFTAGTTPLTVTGIPVVDNAAGDAMTFIRVEL
jgi:hypothetical protein